MERSREATRVAGLASLPAGEWLTVEPMPDFARPTLPYAAYVQPGAFERSRGGRFWVTLPAADEPDAVRAQRLEGHPRKGIAVIACHEGYPGHHLQLATAADHPSIARKALRSNVFIEGWGLYVEELMTELGFLDDPETRLLRLKDLLWRAARVSVDVGLSTGELGFEQAVRSSGRTPSASAAAIRSTRSSPRAMPWDARRSSTCGGGRSARGWGCGRSTTRCSAAARSRRPSRPPSST